MSVKWRYWTCRVELGHPQGGGIASGYTWIAHHDHGSRWEGWEEILSGIGDNGWEVISVVTEERNATNERTIAYRVFCKRPDIPQEASELKRP